MYSITELIVARLKSEALSMGVIIVLLVGLAAGVYLTQQGQTVRSRANIAQEAFVVTDTSDNPLSYRGNNMYRTNTLKIRLRIKDASLLLE